jgi:hypothetical protein
MENLTFGDYGYVRSKRPETSFLEGRLVQVVGISRTNDDHGEITAYGVLPEGEEINFFILKAEIEPISEKKC